MGIGPGDEDRAAGRIIAPEDLELICGQEKEDSSMFKLYGIYAPIATPFVDGKIAYDKLEKNLDFWLKSDLEGIVVMGSNGEFVMLSPEEKVELMRFVCTRAKGKKPVIAGTGAESTMETIRLNEKAAEAGAEAVLVVTPNYYKESMTDSVLARFYTDVALSLIHISEPTRLGMISYAVFCLKK